MYVYGGGYVVLLVRDGANSCFLVNVVASSLLLLLLRSV